MRPSTRAFVVVAGGGAGALAWQVLRANGAFAHLACDHTVPPPAGCPSFELLAGALGVCVAAGAGAGWLYTFVADAMTVPRSVATRGFRVARAVAIAGAVLTPLMLAAAVADAAHQEMEPESAARRRCAVDATSDGVNPSPCVVTESLRSGQDVFLGRLPEAGGWLILWLGGVAGTRVARQRVSGGLRSAPTRPAT